VDLSLLFRGTRIYSAWLAREIGDCRAVLVIVGYINLVDSVEDFARQDDVAQQMGMGGDDVGHAISFMLERGLVEVRADGAFRLTAES